MLSREVVSAWRSLLVKVGLVPRQLDPLTLRDQRALGLRRWFAFLRRALARRLAVFFDMAERLLVEGLAQVGTRAAEATARRRPLVGRHDGTHRQ
jgi:hypothetical protein